MRLTFSGWNRLSSLCMNAGFLFMLSPLIVYWLSDDSSFNIVGVVIVMTVGVLLLVLSVFTANEAGKVKKIEQI